MDRFEKMQEFKYAQKRADHRSLRVDLNGWNDEGPMYPGRLYEILDRTTLRTNKHKRIGQGGESLTKKFGQGGNVLLYLGCEESDKYQTIPITPDKPVSKRYWHKWLAPDGTEVGLWALDFNIDKKSSVAMWFYSSAKTLQRQEDRKKKKSHGSV